MINTLLPPVPWQHKRLLTNNDRNQEKTLTHIPTSVEGGTLFLPFAILLVFVFYYTNKRLQTILTNMLEL